MHEIQHSRRPKYTGGPSFHIFTLHLRLSSGELLYYNVLSRWVKLLPYFINKHWTYNVTVKKDVVESSKSPTKVIQVSLFISNYQKQKQFSVTL